MIEKEEEEKTKRKKKRKKKEKEEEKVLVVNSSLTPRLVFFANNFYDNILFKAVSDYCSSSAQKEMSSLFLFCPFIHSFTGLWEIASSALQKTRNGEGGGGGGTGCMPT